MPAYSFGNRWMGIASLGEPPAPEPLHRMALRLQRRLRLTRIRVAPGLELVPGELTDLIGEVRHRLALREEWLLVQECLEVERAIRLGDRVRLRSWLAAAVGRAHRRRLRQIERGAASRATSAPAPTVPGDAPSSAGLQDTDWASLVPPPPEVPGLPALDPAFADWVQHHVGRVDDRAERWLRWASLHSSYLYESHECRSALGQETLLLLERLGSAWKQVALLERLRAGGDYSERDEVVQALEAADAVRASIGGWATGLGAVHLGRGEATQTGSRGSSRAAGAVAMQLLGAIALVTGRYEAVRAIVDTVPLTTVDRTNWVDLLTRVRRDVTYQPSKEGPDHAPTFVVTATAGRQSAIGRGRSIKQARRAAAEEFVRRHLPHEVPRPARRHRAPAAQPYMRPDAGHAHAVRHVQRTFGDVDAALVAQALTHRSWQYENQAAAAAVGQRDYGVLAREGADVLTALVHHHYVVTTLARTLRPTADEARPPAVERSRIGALFHDLHLREGVLLGNGADLTTDIEADVTQAVIAAAWRSHPGRLVQRQPATLARWSASLRAGLDAASQLERLCSSIKLDSRLHFDDRGPDHQRAFRATYEFVIGSGPSWSGPWRHSKTAAKKAAAEQVLDLLVSGVAPADGAGDGARRALLSGFLLAEMRCAEPAGTVVDREIAARRLGVDRLVAGAWHDFASWAAGRAALVPDSGAAQERLRSYYADVLTRCRRERISALIPPATPQPDGDRRPGGYAEARRGRLPLLHDVLLGLSAETADAHTVIRRWSSTTAAKHTIGQPEDDRRDVMAAGSSAVLDLVLRHAAAISGSTGVVVEVTTSGIDADRAAIAVRLDGIDLGATLHDVLDVAEIVVEGISWRCDDGALLLLLPVLPEQPWPGLVRTAVAAAARSWEDPWLTDATARIHLMCAADHRAEPCSRRTS